MMEKWIRRHQYKLFLGLMIIIALSFISVVKDGGSVIPMSEILGNKAEYIDKIYELEKAYKKHTHYYNGKPR